MIYTGLFLVAVVAQLFIFDSIRVSIWFCPPVYIAFVALLPMNMRPVAVLLLGFTMGVFIDFFEGTGGIHTAATLFTAYARRWLMIVTLGRDVVDEDALMPSVKALGAAKFVRYVALLAGLHCLAYFSLEALTWTNYHLVLLKTLVSGVFTLLAVWMCSMLFTVRTQKRV